MTAPATITAQDRYDIRFPTSRELDGSDAMNVDPDCLAAYVVLRTNSVDHHEGHGFAFTIGRGNDVQVAAIKALEDTLSDLGGVYRLLAHDSQLRSLGPEKGVMQLLQADAIDILQIDAARDYLAISGSMHDRVIEYVDHLHEHFVDPVVIRDGCYVPPAAPGFSARMRPEALERFSFPDGPIWQGEPSPTQSEGGEV